MPANTAAAAMTVNVAPAIRASPAERAGGDMAGARHGLDLLQRSPEGIHAGRVGRILDEPEAAGVLSALGLGVCAEVLFDGPALGVSFPLFVVLLLAVLVGTGNVILGLRASGARSARAVLPWIHDVGVTTASAVSPPCSCPATTTSMRAPRRTTTWA